MASSSVLRLEMQHCSDFAQSHNDCHARSNDTDCRPDLDEKTLEVVASNGEMD